jgi:cbb3-type cytochrome oxidase subunit 3
MSLISPGNFARAALLVFCTGIVLTLIPALSEVAPLLLRVGFLLGIFAYVWDALRFWYYGNWWFSALMIGVPLFFTFFSFRTPGVHLGEQMVFTVLPWTLGILLVLYVLHLLRRSLRPRRDYATYLAYLHDHPSFLWALFGLVVISSLCLAGALYRDDPTQFAQGPLNWAAPIVKPLVIQIINL